MKLTNAQIEELMERAIKSNGALKFTNPPMDRCTVIQAPMIIERFNLLKLLPDRTILSLLEELKAARELAAFYGDEKNYNVSLSGQSTIFEDTDDYPINPAFGKRAREFLKRFVGDKK